MKFIFKKIVFLISSFIVFPFFLVQKAEEKITGTEQLFVFFGQALSLVPGLPGSCLRSAYYAFSLHRASYDVHIGFGTIFCHRDAKICRHASIGMYCVLGSVEVGEGVMIANRVSIPSGRRQHLNDRGEIQGETRRTSIRIGSRSWIGEGAVVMDHIGEHCIVGAGSVVVEEIPASCVVAGNPARLIRKRSERYGR